MASSKKRSARVSKGLRILAAIRLKETDGMPVEIEKNIYIGSIGAAINNDKLLEIGITDILSLCGDIGCEKMDNVVYKYYNVSDKPEKNMELFVILKECINYIDQVISKNNNNNNNTKRKKILIHCMMGKSRSATIIIAYLMYKNNIGWMEALRCVREKRSIVEPNLGFISLLKQFEKDHYLCTYDIITEKLRI